MKLHSFVLAALAVLLSCQAAQAADEIPGALQQRPVALVGGTIHPVDGKPIAKGTLLFSAGRIVALGKKVDIPKDAQQIDVTGKHVYPGLIDAHTNVGLIEINSIRATVDDREMGDVNPNVKSWVAVNPDSEIIPVTRSNGVLLTVAAPSGSLIAGQSALMQLDGWTWEEMTVKRPVGMHIAWPRMSPMRAWWEEKSNKQQLADRDKRLKQLRQALDDARAYQKARAADSQTHPFDSRWEAMLPVLRGEMPIIVEADQLPQIEAAVAFAVEQKLKLILFGGYDAPRCAELLKTHDVPVLIRGTHRLPMRRWEDHDAPFTVPERLRAAGVKYCLAGGARFGASNVRNLPYHAATAAAYGLPRDEALKAITLYPAQILGVADRLGSLTPGKDATLIVTGGDPLETATHVEAAFIQGRKVDLNDRQKRLWKKYEQRYRQIDAAAAKKAK